MLEELLYGGLCILIFIIYLFHLVNELENDGYSLRGSKINYYLR